MIRPFVDCRVSAVRKKDDVAGAVQPWIGELGTQLISRPVAELKASRRLWFKAGAWSGRRTLQGSVSSRCAST
ncbi:hypothetical protein PSAB6_60073 [Paraburkholderia sabiae]|nr:hypothetical protein PSAB6_60073 [Paraburkholderia sabiae]